MHPSGAGTVSGPIATLPADAKSAADANKLELKQMKDTLTRSGQAVMSARLRLDKWSSYTVAELRGKRELNQCVEHVSALLRGLQSQLDSMQAALLTILCKASQLDVQDGYKASLLDLGRQVQELMQQVQLHLHGALPLVSTLQLDLSRCWQPGRASIALPVPASLHLSSLPGTPQPKRSQQDEQVQLKRVEDALQYQFQNKDRLRRVLDLPCDTKILSLGSTNNQSNSSAPTAARQGSQAGFIRRNRAATGQFNNPACAQPDADYDVQALALLGDHVLKLATSLMLLEQKPGSSTGALTEDQTAYNSNPYQKRLAWSMGLNSVLSLLHPTRSTEFNGKALATRVEALFGAMYLDSGWDMRMCTRCAQMLMNTHAVECGVPRLGRGTAGRGPGDWSG